MTGVTHAATMAAVLAEYLTGRPEAHDVRQAYGMLTAAERIAEAVTSDTMTDGERYDALTDGAGYIGAACDTLAAVAGRLAAEGGYAYRLACEADTAASDAAASW